MTYEINETHDAALTSWIESANDPASDFPIQNLPFCRVVTADEYGVESGVGVVIGDFVFDLTRACVDELFDDLDPEMSLGPLTLDDIAELGLESPNLLSRMRRRLVEMFRADADEETKALAGRYLSPRADCDFGVPFAIGDYTDFYASVFHATNVGAMFRPDNPLLPNYKYVPIGYHGRASSIVVSGTEIKRPSGQNRADADAPPVFIPCKNLDYEMEVGFYVGRPNELGESVPLERAEDHIFGLSLVNDWSARDIQAWEYQPLGPFLAKNFATSVAPFVVTLEALAPFRAPAFARPEGDPAPLDYLKSDANEASGGFDVNLEVYILTPKMRAAGDAPFLLSRSNMRDLYWTPAQMLAHHASNGCNLQIGDLIASGTVSGREKNERGCLLELTWRGKEPVELPNGETRRFLEDGDEVIMKGYCEREGFRRIGFGECRGVVKG